VTRDGVREAERRITAIDGGTELDLASLDLTYSNLRALGPAICSRISLAELLPAPQADDALKDARSELARYLDDIP